MSWTTPWGENHQESENEKERETNMDRFEPPQCEYIDDKAESKKGLSTPTFLNPQHSFL